MTEIQIEDGKYTLVSDRGILKALRYGEPWRDLTGDKMIGVMFSEIERLREENTRLREGAESSLDGPISAELGKISKLQQRQDSTNDQLRDLRPFANKLGLYDAADLLRMMVEQPDPKSAAKFKLKIALDAATEAGIFDDMAGDVHPDVINAFCDSFDEFMRRDSCDQSDQLGATPMPTTNG